MAKHLWKPGESGNPNGRPPKHRALTEILSKAGSRTVEYEGRRISGKRLVARLLWLLATTGKAAMPEGAVLMVSPSEWLDVVKFLYTQIDGPPKQEMDLTSGGQPIPIREIVVEFPRDGPVED